MHRLAGSVPLPPYRYVPGLQPHPLQHPHGHGALPCGLTDDQVWRWGIDCFQNRYYWESHEAWEHTWRSLPRPGPTATVVQGLIQAAAYVLKRHMGHDAPRLYAGCRHKLAGDGVVGGVHVADLRVSVERFAVTGAWPTLHLSEPVLAPR